MDIIVKKYRYLIIGLVMIISVFSASGIFNLKIDAGFEQYIPGGVRNRLNIERLDSIFGGSEKIMVIVTSNTNSLTNSSFERVAKLEKAMASLTSIESAFSALDAINIKQVKGYVSFEPIIQLQNDSIPAKTILTQLKNNVLSQRFISDDLKSTAIFLTVKAGEKDTKIISDLNQVIQSNPGPETINIGGQAYIRQSIKSYIVKDLKVLLPVALLLMIFMLFISFREWKGVTIPFIVVIISIITSFAIMSLLGWKISLMTVLMPIMLIAIANDYSIHLINLYQEKYKENSTRSIPGIAIEIYRDLRKPILITALTTIGGVLGLLSHKMPPAFQLGIVVALGITIALILSLYFVPILISFSKSKTKKENPGNKKAIIEHILNIISSIIIKHPKRIVLFFMITAVCGGTGLFFLNVDTNIEGYFSGDSNIKKSINLVNKQFGGSQYISILFEGDVLSPEFLKKIDDYTMQIESLNEVGHIISPTVYLKEFSKGMYSPEESGYGALPIFNFEAEQYLTIMEMSGYSKQIAQLIDPSHNNLRLLVSMRDGSNQTGKKVLDKLHSITKKDTDLVCIAGPGLSKIQIADMVIDGQITSLFAALIIIFILLTMIFKSFSAGIYGTLPLVLSALFLFGIMGYFSIPLDIVTALLSSIMIGVGVDYTIHFLWRYKIEYIKFKDVNLAIKNTLLTSGKGIVFNAFSVIIGFLALILSRFAPLRFFGLLIVISISACLISALLLIPAIIILNKPKFLEK